jgi:2,4-diaminopentanoate dehydrogenase
VSEQIRIVVWPTGNIGKAVLKVAARRDDVDVVGVYVYTDAKAGKDVGAIAGIEDQGVLATSDREAIFALEPDCIVYTPLDIGDFRADEEIKEFLRRGINVVTTLPYQYIGVRGADIDASFQEAGQAGEATLFGAGVCPGFMPERLALTLTGLTAEISDVLIEEFYLICNETDATLNTFGIGVAPPPEGERTPAVELVENLEKQFIYYLGDMFGTPVKELIYTADWHLAPEDIQTGAATIKQGTVAYVSHRWEGITDEDGPSITFQNHWYVSDKVGPADVPGEEYYRVTIEGRPSLRAGVELLASAAEERRLNPGDPTEPVYYAAAATLIQTLPGVIDAAPGVKQIEPPGNSHWRAALRS